MCVTGQLRSSRSWKDSDEARTAEGCLQIWASRAHEYHRPHFSVLLPKPSKKTEHSDSCECASVCECVSVRVCDWVLGGLTIVAPIFPAQMFALVKKVMLKYQQLISYYNPVYKYYEKYVLPDHLASAHVSWRSFSPVFKAIHF